MLLDSKPAGRETLNPALSILFPLRIRVAVAVIGSAFLVAACGGSSGTSNSSGSTPSPSPTPTKGPAVASIDACKLVAEADASTAVGTPVQNLAASGGGFQYPGACIYGKSDGSATVFVFGQVYPDSSAADTATPEQMAAAFQSMFGISNAKAVSGIGDKAVEYTVSSSSNGGSPGMAIFVFKWNVILVIMGTPISDSTKIEALARTAVGNLHSS
jgi:hypothetical protein